MKKKKKKKKKKNRGREGEGAGEGEGGRGSGASETLPTAKAQQLRKRRQTRKVGTPAGAPGGRHIEAVHYVTTQWLLDSVRDGKKATEGRYMCVQHSPMWILSPTMAA